MARRARYSRDPLGLRRALAGWLLPGLVAAMALLAALAVAGAQGAASLADRWQRGAAAAVTVQIPDASPARVERALAALRAMPEIAEARAMGAERLGELLRPWLGGGPAGGALALPAVIEIRLRDARADPVLIGDRLAVTLPGAVVEAHGLWVQRLAALARSLQALSWVVLGLVAAVAAAVVAVATRAGLAARRDAVEVLHGLGARDAEIAGRFARRLGLLAAGGALVGTAAAVPALAVLADLAAPWMGTRSGGWDALPWPALAAVPPVAYLVGWATAQATVRRWLRRLP